MGTVFERMRAIGAAATSALELQRAMGAFGLESDAILGPAAEQRRAQVASRLPRAEWPERPMIVVASMRTPASWLLSTEIPGSTWWTRSRRAPPCLGCSPRTASTGLATSTVACVPRKRRPRLGLCECRGALAVGRTEPTEPGQFDGLRRESEWRTDLASQVEDLRAQGSRVEVVTPDAESRAAMGTNLMDLAARIPTARAAFAQGKREAIRLKFT